MLNGDFPIPDYVTKAVAQLQDAGHETYIVGGAVRDLLLGRKPKDFDVSTAATPEQVVGVYSRRRSIIIGRRFRLVHLRHGKEIVEISTFRRAPSTTQSHSVARPGPLKSDNEYGTPKEDAHRRDFTVNALFYDPVRRRVADHTDMGLEDLRAGVVRAIGRPMMRFAEDPVRVLRALKLVGQYGFELDDDTENALFQSLHKINSVSKARLCLELEKIIRSPYSDGILAAIHDYGLMAHYLPGLERAWESPAAVRALSLLEARNQEIVSGNMPDHIPLGMACIVLPFFMERIGLNPEDHASFWEWDTDMVDILRNTFRQIFDPHAFPKYIGAAVAEGIMLQPRLKAKSKPSRTRHQAHFRLGFEILQVQNLAWWHRKDITDFWQAGTDDSD